MAKPGRLLAHFACALVAALTVGGCTSVPQASAERDAEARQFNTHPATAAIYVYRSDPGGTEQVADSVLWMDSRLIGTTLPRSYCRLDVRPGRRVLHGAGHDTGRLALDASAGEIYFVALNVAGGISYFRQVPVETGKREMLHCCTMMENWAPGQRPLLR
jgi:hypothetical protein